MSLEDIVQAQILMPSKSLVMQDKDKKEYDEGFVLERSPDILTQGQTIEIDTNNCLLTCKK